MFALVSLTIGFNGCGEVDDVDSYSTTKKAETTDTSKLEARNIVPYEEKEHTYYGECRFSDYSMPVLIQNDNPFLAEGEIQSTVPIYFLRKDSEEADVIYGVDFDTLEASENVSFIEYTWSLELSEDKTFYQGYRYYGSLTGNPFHCQVFAALNAKTKDELQDAINKHKK